MRFFNFFLAYMVQKYQNEISPIFYYGKSPKTNEKDLKIPILQPIDWGQPYWMTRYMWKCWIKQFWAAQGASSTDWGYLIVCLYMQTQLAVLWAPCISFLTILWMTRISFILIYSWYQAGVFSVMWSQKTLEHCNLQHNFFSATATCPLILSNST